MADEEEKKEEETPQAGADAAADEGSSADDAPAKKAVDDGEDDGEEGEENAAGGGKKKLFIIIGAAVAVLLLVVGVAAFFLFGSSGEETRDPTLDPNASVAIYDVPPITVNLLTEAGQDHFLKTKLALEIDAADQPEVERLLARLQDDWQNFLRQLRPEDVEGSAAMQRLKEALLLRANQVLSPVVVHNVLFRELLVQ